MKLDLNRYGGIGGEHEGQSNKEQTYTQKMYSATVCMDKSATWVMLPVSTTKHNKTQHNLTNKYSFRHTVNVCNKCVSSVFLVLRTILLCVFVLLTLPPSRALKG